MDDFEWTAYTEGKLFEAMHGYKPVGISKYFEMACIVDKLQDIEVPSDKIWSHLERMFNLSSIDENEGIQFPNDEREFYLPELEFGAMKVKKEEKPEDKNGKSATTKRNENKDTTKTPNTKEVKKEEKPTGKKDNQRRDSKDGKEAKVSILASLKKEVKKEVPEKPKSMKSRSSMNVKEEEKSRTPSRTDEALKRTNKRPTRGSTKPDDPGTPLTRKSQSPLTVTSTTTTKRRRL